MCERRGFKEIYERAETQVSTVGTTMFVLLMYVLVKKCDDLLDHLDAKIRDDKTWLEKLKKNHFSPGQCTYSQRCVGNRKT